MPSSGPQFVKSPKWDAAAAEVAAETAVAAAAATAADPKFFDAYQKKKKDLEQLMEDWESVQEQLDLLS